MIIFDPHYFITVIDPEILLIGNINLEHIIFIWFRPVLVYLVPLRTHVRISCGPLSPGPSELGLDWAESQGGR